MSITLVKAVGWKIFLSSFSPPGLKNWELAKISMNLHKHFHKSSREQMYSHSHQNSDHGKSAESSLPVAGRCSQKSSNHPQIKDYGRGEDQSEGKEVEQLWYVEGEGVVLFVSERYGSVLEDSEKEESDHYDIRPKETEHVGGVVDEVDED